MKKALFIDFGNTKQLDWWTKRGSRMCHFDHIDYLIEKATGEAVGEFVAPRGLSAKRVIKEGSKFHKNSKTIVVEG